jgi:RNA polymerase sigma factor (sigma-70 family)
MVPEGSITRCLGELKEGDPSAARKLWECYYQRTVGLARQRLRGVPRRAADEEDVALSAFDSVFRGIERGRFPQLQDRDDLWQVLAVVTARKAINLVNHERRHKRGGGGVSGESRLLGPEASDVEGRGLDQVISPGPTPEQAAQMAEECQRLLDLLDDDMLRTLAIRKLEGCTNDEIAAQFRCDRRTVERKLRRIRAEWQEDPGR